MSQKSHHQLSGSGLLQLLWCRAHTGGVYHHWGTRTSNPPHRGPEGQVCRAGSQVPAWLSPASYLRLIGSIRTPAAPTAVQELIGKQKQQVYLPAWREIPKVGNL